MRRALHEANQAPLQSYNLRLGRVTNAMIMLCVQWAIVIMVVVAAYKESEVPWWLLAVALAANAILVWVTVLPLAKDVFDRSLND